MQENSNAIVLIDPLPKRRVRIERMLMKGGFAVTSHANCNELNPEESAQAVVLMYDGMQEFQLFMRNMIEEGYWIRVVPFADAFTPQQVYSAATLGAWGYLPWPFQLAELEAIFFETDGCSRESCEWMKRKAAARRQLLRLTNRERDVLDGLAKGLTSRRIGELLNISPRTVDVYRSGIVKKLGVPKPWLAARLVAYSDQDELRVAES